MFLAMVFDLFKRPTRNVVKIAPEHKVNVDTLYAHSFGTNYAGHPRSDVSFMLSQQDAELRDKISSALMQQAAPAPSISSDADVNTALDSIASRYIGSPAEFEAYVQRIGRMMDAEKIDSSDVVDVVKTDVKAAETDTVNE